ncbi:MAG: CotH kinase family protein [Clostridium sp.]
MIQSKCINIVIAIAVVFALIASIALIGLGNTPSISNSAKVEPLYTTQLFGTDIISIEILADEAQWQEMLDNAISEPFIMADVIVNGTKFQNVEIRPKGNSSLTQVANSDSNRYSFRLQFDEYVKDQTCFGLQSFVVNNMLGDNTYMKEYISYDIMKEAGVDSPCFGYADVKLNGENWGLYLAVELYDDSYEQRVQGTTAGMLYNVKTMDMGGGADNDGAPIIKNNGNKGEIPGGGNLGEIPQVNTHATQPNDTIVPPENIQTNKDGTNTNIDSSNGGFPGRPDGGNMGGGKMGGSGGSLEYTDDTSSSYSSIFDNVVGKSTEDDYQRVITALKALSEGQSLETYFDVDKILRYLAAHTMVVNLDSYSSSMAQNYYIYENDGKITILPWDYNLAWGGFKSGSASSVINFPIDTPVSGVEMSTRPLLEKLFANEDYLELYHSYLQSLIDEYFIDGKFEAKVSHINTLIETYVENDKTAFCTLDEYKTAVKAFVTLGNLRSESVQGQLDGSVPSTTAEQNSNPNALIPAENLNLNDLGSMMGGGMGGNHTDGNIPSSNSPDGNTIGKFPNENKPMSNNTSGMQPNNNALPTSGTAASNESNQNYFILLGSLVLALMVAIAFVSKYKKHY